MSGLPLFSPSGRLKHGVVVEAPVKENFVRLLPFSLRVPSHRWVVSNLLGYKLQRSLHEEQVEHVAN